VVRRLVCRSRRAEAVEGVLIELDARTVVFVPLEDGATVPQLGDKVTAWTTLHHLRQALLRENMKRTASAVRFSE
jgi:hypothetical protein